MTKGILGACILLDGSESTRLWLAALSPASFESQTIMGTIGGTWPFLDDAAALGSSSIVHTVTYVDAL